MNAEPERGEPPTDIDRVSAEQLSAIIRETAELVGLPPMVLMIRSLRCYVESLPGWPKDTGFDPDDLEQQK